MYYCYCTATCANTMHAVHDEGSGCKWRTKHNSSSLCLKRKSLCFKMSIALVVINCNCFYLVTWHCDMHALCPCVRVCSNCYYLFLYTMQVMWLLTTPIRHTPLTASSAVSNVLDGRWSSLANQPLREMTKTRWRRETLVLLATITMPPSPITTV